MSKTSKRRPGDRQKFNEEYDRIFKVHTKYCPHCGSTKIHRVEEVNLIPVGDEYYEDKTHYHECEDCNETWEHHEVK